MWHCEEQYQKAENKVLQIVAHQRLAELVPHTDETAWTRNADLETAIFQPCDLLLGVKVQQAHHCERDLNYTLMLTKRTFEKQNLTVVQQLSLHGGLNRVLTEHKNLNEQDKSTGWSEI